MYDQERFDKLFQTQAQEASNNLLRTQYLQGEIDSKELKSRRAHGFETFNRTDSFLTTDGDRTELAENLQNQGRTADIYDLFAPELIQHYEQASIQHLDSVDLEPEKLDKAAEHHTYLRQIANFFEEAVGGEEVDMHLRMEARELGYLTGMLAHIKDTPKFPQAQLKAEFIAHYMYTKGIATQIIRIDKKPHELHDHYIVKTTIGESDPDTGLTMGTEIDFDGEKTQDPQATNITSLYHYDTIAIKPIKDKDGKLFDPSTRPREIDGELHLNTIQDLSVMVAMNMMQQVELMRWYEAETAAGRKPKGKFEGYFNGQEERNCLDSTIMLEEHGKKQYGPADRQFNLLEASDAVVVGESTTNPNQLDHGFRGKSIERIRAEAKSPDVPLKKLLWEYMSQTMTAQAALYEIDDPNNPPAHRRLPNTAATSTVIEASKRSTDDIAEANGYVEIRAGDGIGAVASAKAMQNLVSTEKLIGVVAEPSEVGIERVVNPVGQLNPETIQFEVDKENPCIVTITGDFPPRHPGKYNPFEDITNLHMLLVTLDILDNEEYSDIRHLQLGGMETKNSALNTLTIELANTDEVDQFMQDMQNYDANQGQTSIVEKLTQRDNYFTTNYFLTYDDPDIKPREGFGSYKDSLEAKRAHFQAKAERIFRMMTTSGFSPDAQETLIMNTMLFGSQEAKEEFLDQQSGKFPAMMDAGTRTRHRELFHEHKDGTRVESLVIDGIGRFEYLHGKERVSHPDVREAIYGMDSLAATFFAVAERKKGENDQVAQAFFGRQAVEAAAPANERELIPIIRNPE